MDDKMALLEYLPSLKSIDDKRGLVISLDQNLKALHDQGKTIITLNPHNILIDKETKQPIFSQDLSDSTGFTNLEAWKRLNTIWLADLEMCIYLYPNYNLDYGLMDLELLSNNFSDFSSFIPSTDVEYYRQILDSSYYISNDKPIYLSTFNLNNGSQIGTSRTYVKATAAGKAMANNENGVINYLFITCVVFCLIVLTILLAVLLV